MKMRTGLKALALFSYVILIGISYMLQHSESTMHIKKDINPIPTCNIRYQPMVEKIPTVLGPLIQRN